MKNYIKVSGDYYELGFQQGKKFATEIRSTYSRMLNSKIVNILKPKLLPKFLFSFMLKHQLLKKWKRPLEFLLSQYFYRIKGLSDGSQTPINELFVLQSLEIMANDTTYFLGGCSSVCVLPSSLKTASTILAKNFDYFSDFATDHLVRQSNPKNGYKSLEVTYKQIVGSHDGINEKGLVVLYNYGLTVEKTEKRIPITILVQQILERCSNVEEAITFIKTFRYPNGAILTLADSTNTAVCVEITPEHLSIRKPENGILVATNHYLSYEIKPYDIPHNAVFSNKTLPQELRQRRVHESSETRYNRLNQLIRKNLFIGIKEMEIILKDHNNNNSGDDNTICRHGELLSTQVGVIFVPKNRMIKIFFGNPCKTNSLTFCLE
jgi:predicted choloylglycine hydrolase